MRIPLRLWSLQVLELWFSTPVPREGAADSNAYAHSAGPRLWFAVVLRGRCVAWSRGPMPNQVACRVVGLWCVCVFCLPRGSQKAPKIIQMGHLLMLFRSILGQGGTGEDPKINRNMKQAKKNKREDEQMKKNDFV